MRILAVLALALACASCSVTPDPHHRLMSDNEMIDLFQRERASFDSLAVMLDEDRNIGMMDSYARTSQGAGPPWTVEIPEARRAAYERLLRRVRCSRNIWSDDDGILMQQFVQKWMPNPRDNWMRGYWYARKPLDKWRVTTENLLGDRDKTPTQSEIRYRHLVGNWYLYTDHGYNG